MHNKLFLKIFVSLLVLIASAYSTAEQANINQLETLQTKVLKEPLSVLAMLNDIEPDEQLDSELYYLWLLRKVQALNYSYQFEQFNQILERLNDVNALLISQKLKIQFHYFKGIKLQRDGEYQDAINLFKQAIEVAKAEEEDYLHTLILVELVYTLSLSEEYELAMLELHTAYQKANKLNDTFLSGLVEESNAVLLGYREQYEESLKHYQRALKNYQQLGFPYYLGESAYGLASTYRYAGEWDKALNWYEKYHELVGHFETRYPEFFYYYGVGMTNAEKGDCNASLAAISKVLSVKGFKDYKAELYKRMSYCLAKLKDFVAADAALDQARIVYSEMPELQGTTWALEVDKVEAQIDAMKGNYENAYKTMSQYYQQLLNVNKKSSNQRLDKLRLTIQNERKRLVLSLLEKEAELQEKELQVQLRKNEVQKIWLSSAIVLIVIVVGVLLWQIRISRKFRRIEKGE